MFVYHTFIFGLKENQPVTKHLSIIKELLGRRNVIIYEHCADGNESCGRSRKHYHGVIETISALGFNNDKILTAVRNLCCYFKADSCHDLAECLAYIESPPMRHFMTVIREPSRLKCAVNNFPHSSALLHGNVSPFRSLAAFKVDLIHMVKKFCLKNPSLQQYLTPFDSSVYISRWCKFQKIDPQAFVKDWINCLDGKLKEKNSLYFQESPNSCIRDIADSIMDACGPLSVGKVFKETTGYAYFWKECIDKRMIALIDPHFDANYFYDELLKILEGSGTNIKKSHNVTVYVQQTPVVVIAQEHPWESNSQLQLDVEARLVNSYTNLVTFEPPTRKLHPDWLYIFKNNLTSFDEYLAPGIYNPIGSHTQNLRRDTPMETLPNEQNGSGAIPLGSENFLGTQSKIATTTDKREVKTQIETPSAQSPNILVSETRKVHDTSILSQENPIPDMISSLSHDLSSSEDGSSDSDMEDEFTPAISEKRKVHDTSMLSQENPIPDISSLSHDLHYSEDGSSDSDIEEEVTPASTSKWTKKRMIEESECYPTGSLYSENDVTPESVTQQAKKRLAEEQITARNKVFSNWKQSFRRPIKPVKLYRTLKSFV